MRPRGWWQGPKVAARGANCLDFWADWWLYGPAMSERVPHLMLPTGDYEQMLQMSSRQLVCVLREHVLAPAQVGRFSPRPPAEYDAYVVRRQMKSLDVELLRAGAVVFCCRFVASEY